MSKSGWKGEKQRHSLAKRGVKTNSFKTKKEEDHYYQSGQSIKDMFKPGGEAYGKPHFDDDWYRYFPDGTTENHELCSGCQPDGSCSFHPIGCTCSGGTCQEKREMKKEYDMPILSYPRPELLPKDIKEELIHEFNRSLQFDMTPEQAIFEVANYVIDNWENELEAETGLDIEISMPTYHAMERFLVQYNNKGGK